MGIAIFGIAWVAPENPLTGLRSVFQNLWAGLRARTDRRASRSLPSLVADVSPAAARQRTLGSAARSSAKRPQRPLRVVQVVDGGQSRQSAGRMVISGRMADVCAELDRLAACAAVCPD